MSFFKEDPDVFQTFLVPYQLFAKYLGNGFLGQVVVGGTQAAGGDDDVGPGCGPFQHFGKAGGIVAHGGLVKGMNADLCQGPGDISSVGVGDFPEQKLGTDGDNFTGFGHDSPPF